MHDPEARDSKKYPKVIRGSNLALRKCQYCTFDETFAWHTKRHARTGDIPLADKESFSSWTFSARRRREWSTSIKGLLSRNSRAKELWQRGDIPFSVEKDLLCMLFSLLFGPFIFSWDNQEFKKPTVKKKRDLFETRFPFYTVASNPLRMSLSYSWVSLRLTSSCQSFPFLAFPSPQDWSSGLAVFLCSCSPLFFFLWQVLLLRSSWNPVLVKLLAEETNFSFLQRKEALPPSRLVLPLFPRCFFTKTLYSWRLLDPKMCSSQESLSCLMFCFFADRLSFK